ncbi:hypothetical protein [Klebsiella pneumoniae]|uniref:hypothetical protein n=1 Tax=Klebsiella pneumoniae TaxID=573 RepID=UPI000E2B1237|nr:hypothetical protein [Klebsiella pneumoniae]SXB99904.1 Uncharacterised protein [Klebsiella pneumoniae]
MMKFASMFNRTSTQRISAHSFRGEPITVLHLGYATVYEFTEMKMIVTNSNLVTIVDSNAQTQLIAKDSYFFQCALARLQQSDLLMESVLGVV